MQLHWEWNAFSQLVRLFNAVVTIKVIKMQELFLQPLHNVSNKPFSLFNALSKIGKVRRQQQLRNLPTQIWPCQWYHSRGFFFFSLACFLCCLMNENVNQNKNGEMIISQAKAINKAAQRVLMVRDVKKFYHHKALFPSFSLRFMLSIGKIITLHLNLCYRLGFSLQCYHFHSELRALLYSHSHFFLRDATGRGFLCFSGDSFLPDLQAHNRLVV